MSCCAVSCYAVLCCAMLCYAVPCHNVMFPALPCPAVLCHAMPLYCAVLCSCDACAVKLLLRRQGWRTCAVLCCAVLCCAMLMLCMCSENSLLETRTAHLLSLRELLLVGPFCCPHLLIILLNPHLCKMRVSELCTLIRHAHLHAIQSNKVTQAASDARPSHLQVKKCSTAKKI